MQLLLHLQSVQTRNVGRSIVKTGIFASLILQMDDDTFQSHLRVTRQQYNMLLCQIQRMESDNDNAAMGHGRVPLWKELLIVLWYLANQNCLREISDKFNVSKSSAYRVVMRMVKYLNRLSPAFIKLWTDEEKIRNSQKFLSTGFDNVIGAIDGCHIRIARPQRHGDDYMNRNGYFSILLQGVCDHDGNFKDVFIGVPGKVHDARMLRMSPFFANMNMTLGNDWRILGDSAYVSQDFPWILTPTRDNGVLTPQQTASNTALSRGRVIIENTFGRLICKFRRFRGAAGVEKMVGSIV